MFSWKIFFGKKLNKRPPVTNFWIRPWERLSLSAHGRPTWLQSCLVVQCTCLDCTALTAFSIASIAFEKSKWFSLQTTAFWSEPYELKRVMEPRDCTRDCWKNFPPNHGRWLLLRSCWSRLIQRVLWADRLPAADHCQLARMKIAQLLLTLYQTALFRANTTNKNKIGLF